MRYAARSVQKACALLWTNKLLATLVALLSLAFPGDLQFLGSMTLSFWVLDNVAGISASLKRGEAISSKRMRDSGWKLIGYAMLVVCALALDCVISQDWTPPIERVTTRQIVLAWLLVVEVISILENVRVLGVPVPAFISTQAKAAQVAAEEAEK